MCFGARQPSLGPRQPCRRQPMINGNPTKRAEKRAADRQREKEVEEAVSWLRQHPGQGPAAAIGTGQFPKPTSDTLFPSATDSTITSSVAASPTAAAVRRRPSRRPSARTSASSRRRGGRPSPVNWFRNQPKFAKGLTTAHLLPFQSEKSGQHPPQRVLTVLPGIGSTEFASSTLIMGNF